ncbi:glycoside hydrolase family 3 N-terminal domain-containing protein [Virgibacillus xinjiangensis]|uniref:beta-N-acetylhexosaminidase n=1 Tax=Virgibacillus xinjiangensis TaxID=393090 RepID=A0ABV7CZK7_9BACI
MKSARTSAFLTLASAVLLMAPFGTAIEPAKAADSQAANKLMILQNVPEASVEVEDGQIDLTALNIQEDGHFTSVSENLAWQSKNENVATVDKDGTVTFTGQNGRSFITVSDGSSTDRIAVHTKPSGQMVIKQKGSDYDLIDQAIDNMTLNEKIGQMLMPDFRTWNGQNVTEMLPEIERIVQKYHLGGVILFRENVVTTEQTAKLVAAYQEASEKYGLLMTIDQEGGVVTRLQSGTDMPGNMALGATRSEELTEQVGRAIGEELQSLGINMNLAPVMDVNNNPDNPVIGVRSFGESPELVADLGISYTQGLQQAGVATTAKHFPGHGDTSVDSHLGLPEVPYDKERLSEVELYPFQKAMDAGIDAIMTAHVTFPNIDDTKVVSQKDGSEISLPATLSHKVLTGLMREEMGFDGVIITDALNMRAISDHFGSVDAVKRAVKAGTDIILMPVGLEEVADGLREAVEDGEISEQRIEESVARILELKLNRGILKEKDPASVEAKIAEAENTVGSQAHKQVEQRAAEQSITLVKNDDVLPLDLSSDDQLAVVGNTFSSNLHEAVKDYHGNTALITSDGPLTKEELEELEGIKAIIAGTYTYNVAGRSPDSSQMRLVHQLIEELEVPVIGIGIRNPYDLMAYPQIDAYLAQYGFRNASFQATAATLFGDNQPSGMLPVTIPDQEGNVLFDYGLGLSY